MVLLPSNEAVILKLFAFAAALAAVPLLLLLATLHGSADGELEQCVPACQDGLRRDVAVQACSGCSRETLRRTGC